MTGADRQALEARDRIDRDLNEGTRYTLRWLLDEVEATRGAWPEAEAIRMLVEERVERYLFSRSEADKILDLLDRWGAQPYGTGEASAVKALRSHATPCPSCGTYGTHTRAQCERWS